MYKVFLLALSFYATLKITRSQILKKKSDGERKAQTSCVLDRIFFFCISCIFERNRKKPGSKNLSIEYLFFKRCKVNKLGYEFPYQLIKKFTIQSGRLKKNKSQSKSKKSTKTHFLLKFFSIFFLDFFSLIVF